MTTPLRVAIAGCHRMLMDKLTNHNFAAAFNAVPETAMVAVFDLGAATRADFRQCWGDMPAYDDFGRMLREVAPDILCIATRQTMHADQIEQAATAGVRGILCDKPLATTLTETDRIVIACRENDVRLLFGLDRRQVAPYRHLCTRIADGMVGEVNSVVVHGLPNLINHGCHWYDTTLMLLGDPEPIWVSGFVDDVAAEPPDSRRRMDPSGRGQVGLENGIVLYFSPTGGRKPSFEIVGDAGRLFILNDAAEAHLWTADDGANGCGLRRLDLPALGENWPAGPAMARDLVHAVTNDEATACDVEHARRATEIGFAFHLSHAQGGAKVTLPTTDRTLSIPSFPWGNE